MKLRRLIRHNARCALQGRWTAAVAIILTLTAASLLFLTLQDLTAFGLGLELYLDPFGTPGLLLDDLPNPAPALLLLLTAWTLLYAVASLPLRLGSLRWFYRVGNGEVPPYADIFGLYAARTQALRAVALYARMLLGVTLVLALAVLPPGVLYVLAGRARAGALSDADALLAIGAQAASLILGLLLLLFALIWSCRYFLAPFILLDEPELTVGELLAKSAAASRQRRVDLLLLECSLLPWRLLGLFQVTALYTAPFVSTVRGLYARYLLECHERHIFAQAPETGRGGDAECTGM